MHVGVVFSAQELDVPHFHHEFVYLAIMLVLESGKSDVTDPICSCLGALGKSAIITTNQMERVSGSMPEIKLLPVHFLPFELSPAFALLFLVDLCCPVQS